MNSSDNPKFNFAAGTFLKRTVADNQNPGSGLQKRLRDCVVLVLACLAAIATISVTGESRAGFTGDLPAQAKLTFVKVLEGSVPEFVEITVDSSGAGAYDGRKLSDPPSPRPLQLSPPTTQRLFALARALNYFKSADLDCHKKVANLGRKTFTYEAGGQKSSTQFNYSLRRDAQELAELFEKVGSVQEHVKTLEYASKYDHLSLPRELLQIQIDLDNKALSNPELLVPALEDIVRNPHFLHLAQVRAQNILQRIR